MAYIKDVDLEVVTAKGDVLVQCCPEIEEVITLSSHNFNIYGFLAYILNSKESAELLF